MDDEGSNRALIRGALVVTPLLAVIPVVALLVAPSCTHADSAADTLSCSKELAIHRYSPESPGATVLRTRTGVELRASERLLTITPAIVAEALVSEYRERVPPGIGEEGPPLERSFFVVALQLTPAGRREIDKAVPAPSGTRLVLVCNGVVLTGLLARYGNIQGVDVFLDVPSANAAQEFARSFTPHVRFEQGTRNAE